jgi:putative transcriptional regulator
MATVRVGREAAEHALRTTDWTRVDATTDEEIARQIAADPDTAPEVDAAAIADAVRSVRRRTGLSQARFAARFRIPVRTLQDWEQARRRPDVTTLAYLRVIDANPEIVRKALGAA